MFRPSPRSEAVCDGGSAELVYGSAFQVAFFWASVGLTLKIEMVSRKG